ncbi:MAG: exonuclease SbcC [Rhodococcus sp.]|nr:exonuclease SbcC [Rhodococcus sp. (in: high G+C Gram-positive bacteria)]
MGDFSLTALELREVAAFALASAAEVLPLYESVCPEDERPRRATEAAQEFVGGAPRSKLQRTAAPAAHRAAKDAPSAVAFHAAMAAGDAAASAYLHPLADPAQVGHILRASAHAARAAELARPDFPHAVDASLDDAIRRATPTLVSVLSRYPATEISQGSNRIAQLVHQLDTALRDPEFRGSR